MVILRRDRPDEAIRAVIILEVDHDNLSDLDFNLGGSKAEVRSGWIGSECFPATELWSDDNGFMLIESRTGNVYGVHTIDVEWLGMSGVPNV